MSDTNSTKLSKKMKRILYLLAFYIITSFQMNAQDLPSSITFNENTFDGSTGEGTLSIDIVDAQTVRVNYSFEKDALPNPYTVNFNYDVKIIGSNHVLEPYTVFDHLDMRIDENIEMTYEGSDLLFPLSMTVGNTLPDVSGIYTLNHISRPIDFTYQVNITNRIVNGVETINVGGFELLAYAVSYDYTLEKSVNGNIISTTQESISDTYIPMIGVVERARIGEVENGDQLIQINTKSSITTSSVSDK